MSDTSNSPVIVQRDDAVGIVTLNRPDKRNALDLTMHEAIAAAFTELERTTP
jgi:enoyl-CoA hydratase/carnithine racemase